MLAVKVCASDVGSNCSHQLESLQSVCNSFTVSWKKSLCSHLILEGALTLGHLRCAQKAQVHNMDMTL